MIRVCEHQTIKKILNIKMFEPDRLLIQYDNPNTVKIFQDESGWIKFITIKTQPLCKLYTIITHGIHRENLKKDMAKAVKELYKIN